VGRRPAHLPQAKFSGLQTSKHCLESSINILRLCSTGILFLCSSSPRSPSLLSLSPAPTVQARGGPPGATAPLAQRPSVEPWRLLRWDETGTRRWRPLMASSRHLHRCQPREVAAPFSSPSWPQLGGPRSPCQSPSAALLGPHRPCSLPHLASLASGLGRYVSDNGL
jgi:hypothetical protein